MANNTPLEGIPFSTPDEIKGNAFIEKAIRLVREEIDSHNDDAWPLSGAPNDPPVIYVVWFVKVLQNWKALLSTNIPDGRYYEVTYNGDKEEAYVDTYQKILNTLRSDNEESND